MQEGLSKTKQKKMKKKGRKTGDDSKECVMTWEEHKAKRLRMQSGAPSQDPAPSREVVIVERLVAWLRQKGPHEWHDLGAAGTVLAATPVSPIPNQNHCIAILDKLCSDPNAFIIN